MMEKTQTHWTYTDLDRLPDELKRYELWKGELIMAPAPSMRHQTIVQRLLWALAAYDPDLKQGEYYTAPADVVLADDWTVQPDIFFVTRKRTHIVKARKVLGPPDLCIEILSPSTTTHDATRKLEAYAKGGVKEYWLIDPFTFKATIYVLSGRSYQLHGEFIEGDTLTSVVLPDFSHAISALFTSLPHDENE